MKLRGASWYASAAAIGCTIVLSAAPVSAFSDPASFASVTLAAGGGGRFFTGSPADGYTCKVCHDGGPQPKVTVLGLPLEGYRPSARYEITVSWPDEVEKIAAALELTDARGIGAGTVQLPPEGEILPPEFCAPATDAVLAATISAAPNQREVINLPDCGAKRIRLLWTAPPADVGPVWFAGSSVWSDGEADPYNDGATDFARVLAAPAVTSVATQSCAVRQVQGSRPCVAILCAGLYVLGYLRRTRRRRVVRSACCAQSLRQAKSRSARFSWRL
jgi:hypothetical protein